MSRNGAKLGEIKQDLTAKYSVNTHADSVLCCASVPDYVNISEIVITPKVQAGDMIYKE